MAYQNPSAKAGEKEDIVAARRLAAAQLQPLFVESKDDKDNPAPGVFHTFGIKRIVESSPDYAKYIDELRANPHARSLCIVAASRGNKNFLPALVAEFLARPEMDEDNDWFARVYMGGLADIFAATGVGLMLPASQPGIDLARGAYNVIVHLSDEEKEKLGLYEADEAPRRQLATDLMAMIEEGSLPLTPAQQLFRWAIRKREAHQQATPRGGSGSQDREDPAAVLPQATPAAPKPEPETPKGPVIPDLSVLTGGGSAPVAPPRASRGKKVVAAVPAVPAIAPPTATPAADKPKPAPAAPTAEDEDREIIIRALEASDNVAAKATASLLRKGKMTLAEATAVAPRKGLL